MGFDWSAYIVIAEDIFTKANNGEYLEKKEAWLRAAISRAYYGVHMLVKTQSLKTGYTRQDELNNNQKKNVQFNQESEEESEFEDDESDSDMIFRSQTIVTSNDIKISN